jgi:hypothetical protein
MRGKVNLVGILPESHFMPFSSSSNLARPILQANKKNEFLRFFKKQMGLAEKDYEPGRIIFLQIRMIHTRGKIFS